MPSILLSSSKKPSKISKEIEAYTYSEYLESKKKYNFKLIFNLIFSKSFSIPNLGSFNKYFHTLLCFPSVGLKS